MDVGGRFTVQGLGLRLMAYPEGPCTQIVYTLAPMYLYKEYFKANVYTIWVHGPSGLEFLMHSGIVALSTHEGFEFRVEGFGRGMGAQFWKQAP